MDFLGLLVVSSSASNSETSSVSSLLSYRKIPMKQNESQLSACLLHTRRHTNWDGRQIQSGTTLWDSPPRERARTVLSTPIKSSGQAAEACEKTTACRRWACSLHVWSPLLSQVTGRAGPEWHHTGHHAFGSFKKSSACILVPKPFSWLFSPMLNLVCLESLLFLPSQGPYSINFPFFIYTFLDLQVFLF